MGSAVGSLDLTDVKRIKAGWHVGLDEPPLNDIAIAHQGAEGKDKDIFHGIADEGIAMERRAQARGTGIARRTPQALCRKIYEGKAVIAVTADGGWAGFSYAEVWGEGAFVS